MKRFFSRLLNAFSLVAVAALSGLAAYFACVRWLRLWPQEAIIAAIGVSLSVLAVAAVSLLLRQGGKG
ncbi:MAG: hypothetical protein LBU39_03420 [Desulfobulbaceae bacterium]|jgi:hypothetical protein|nr:hypothetical protein [Desulfobulbaceae bacterium]